MQETPSHYRSLGLAVLIAIGLATPALEADAQGAGSIAKKKTAPRNLTIVGSGYTMPAMLEGWAQEFERRTGIAVEIIGSGTSTGPPALLDGTADLAAMTRPLRKDESEALTQALGTVPVQVPIAVDAVAIFVHADNPIEKLTLQQVDAIFSEDRRCGGARRIDRWNQVGLRDAFDGRRIALFGRRAGSGTGSFFKSAALCGGAFRDWVQVSPGRSSAALRVAESRFGIGFGSLRDQVPGMRVVPLSETDEAPALDPQTSLERDTRYPLRRSLNLVVLGRGNRKANQNAIDFVRLALEESSQSALTALDFYPLPAGLREAALKRLDSLSQP